MYDPRNTLAHQRRRRSSRSTSATSSIRTVIPRNVRLAEAPSHGVPALKLEPQSKGALAYLALAGEMLRRMEARRTAAPGGADAASSVATATQTMIRPKGLGRGLDALLAGGDERTPRDALQTIAIDRIRAGQVSAADADGRGVARRTRRFDSRAGRDAADPRAAGRRRAVRDHRRRAPLARRAARGTEGGAGAGQERAGQRRARAGADREHPARRPESAGRGVRACSA